MNADEMFEALGYEKNDNVVQISYHKNGHTIIFHISEKYIAFSQKTNFLVIRKELWKAIQAKIVELGWLDD